MTSPLPAFAQRVIDDIIAREGDYSNHPADKGGPTRYGITQAVARAQGYHGDMKALPRSVAVSIYAEIYYQGPGFDRLASIFPRLTEELVDTGVNMGPGRAAGYYQRAVNILNRQGRDYPDIVVDNRIGPRSVAAGVALKARRGADAEKVLFRICDGFQRTRYAELCEQRQANEEFAFGWFNNRTGDPKEFSE